MHIEHYHPPRLFLQDLEYTQACALPFPAHVKRLMDPTLEKLAQERAPSDSDIWGLPKERVSSLPKHNIVSLPDRKSVV